jgi:membrane-bound lytic murein transglycosylase D
MTQPIKSRPSATLRLPVAPASQVSGARLAAVVAPQPEAPPSGPPPATSPRAIVTAQQVSDTLAEQREESRAAEQSAVTPEPVTESEVEEHSPSLVPGGAVARASESIDFAIRADGTILVAAEETLGHYAQWLGVPTSRLRTLNNLSARASVPLGRTLKLDFSKASHDQFDAKRRDFHDAMQATFFSAHRIVGTQVYVTRRGDSLWNVAQRGGGLPAWLVLHYNPDIDFTTLRTGQEIVIPKIEVLASG